MKTNMKRILPVYLLTIFLTLVLVGTTAVIVFLKINSNKPDDSSANTNTSDQLKFKPTSEHSQTVLFIYDSGDEVNDVSFALMRFLPEDQQVIFIPVPTNTYSQVNTLKSDVYDFYRKGGALMASYAVSEAFDIPVEKYMKFNRDSFNTLVNVFGGVTFSVPQNISYTDEITKENTSLFSGKQYMDGTILTKMMTYPGYPTGEEYRIKLSVGAIVDMINQASAERLKNELDDSFNSIINIVDTNINAFDFSFRKSSIAYILDKAESPANIIVTNGKTDENGKYILDENFITDIKIKFDIYNDIEKEN